MHDLRLYCDPVIDRATATTEEWLAARRVGASDVGSLLGVDPARSAWVTIARMKGLIDPEHPTMCDEPTCPICWGTDLEPAVLHRFARRHPELRVEPCSITYRSIACPWLQASPDALAWHEGGVLEVVDAKCPTGAKIDEWVGPDDDERVPERYVAQVLAQMIVTGARSGRLVAMIHGRVPRYVERVVEWSDDDARLIVDTTREAWSEVQTDGEPSARWLVGSPAEARAIGQVTGAGDGSAAELDEETASLLEAWRYHTDEAAELQRRADECTARAAKAKSAAELAIGHATTASGCGWAMKRRMQRGAWVFRDDVDAADVARVRADYMRQTESRRIDIRRIK